MGEIAKKLYIKKNDIVQTAKLYSSAGDCGSNYGYLKVDGATVYVPLGVESDGRATIGRVKESTGKVFAILAYATHADGDLLAKVTYSNTITFTTPADCQYVSFVQHMIVGVDKWNAGEEIINTQRVSVLPNTTYTITYGAYDPDTHADTMNDVYGYSGVERGFNYQNHSSLGKVLAPDTSDTSIFKVYTDDGVGYPYADAEAKTTYKNSTGKEYPI